MPRKTNDPERLRRRMRRRMRRFPQPIHAFRDEMDRALDRAWRGYERMAFAPEDWSIGSLSPHLDMVETDDAIVVEADLPGLDEADIEVTFDEGLLTIRGEKASRRSDEAAHVHLSEREFGTFRRSIPIDAAIDEDEVTASYKGGVLTVTLPLRKGGGPRSKRIEITSG
jgi:HSP20 family protein